MTIRWQGLEQVYRSSFEKMPFPALGDVQFVQVADDLTVGNLMGQHGVHRPKGASAACRSHARLLGDAWACRAGLGSAA